MLSKVEKLDKELKIANAQNECYVVVGSHVHPNLACGKITLGPKEAIAVLELVKTMKGEALDAAKKELEDLQECYQPNTIPAPGMFVLVDTGGVELAATHSGSGFVLVDGEHVVSPLSWRWPTREELRELERRKKA